MGEWYRSTLDGAREADADLIDNLHRQQQKIAEDERVVDQAMTDLALSTDAESKSSYSLLKIIYQCMARISSIGAALMHQARICKDVVRVVYVHLNDVRARHERHVADVEKRLGDLAGRIETIEDVHKTARTVWSVRKEIWDLFKIVFVFGMLFGGIQYFK